MTNNLNDFINNLCTIQSIKQQNMEKFLNLNNIKFKKSQYNFFFEFENYTFIIINNPNHYYSNINFYNLILPEIKPNNFIGIAYWKEPSSETTLFSPKLICKLFAFLKHYKSFCFKDLNLENIYFSKKYNQFFFKTIPDYINIQNFPYQNSLSFNPRNILENQPLFSYKNNNISYIEFIDFKITCPLNK